MFLARADVFGDGAAHAELDVAGELVPLVRGQRRPRGPPQLLDDLPQHRVLADHGHHVVADVPPLLAMAPRRDLHLAALSARGAVLPRGQLHADLLQENRDVVGQRRAG